MIRGATAILVMLLIACANPPASQPAASRYGRAQLLFRIAGNNGKTATPVRVRVILRSRSGQAYDVSRGFPTETSGDDMAVFFEHSLNSAGFRAFRSTRSVFVEPVYEAGANCSHDSVVVTLGRNSADLVTGIPVAKPDPPAKR